MATWQRYQPTAEKQWDRRRVVHLHRRTVFGPAWNEVERDVSSNPEDAVNRILYGECRIDGVPDDFDNIAHLIGDSATQSRNADRVKAWWIYRCLFTSDPLQERLTLMWHNHFSTSNLKVDSLPLMLLQNETLRQHSRAPFRDLLQAMLRDPALLVWLDAPANRRGHPNENLPRELMELFTLGIGHYSENDVKQAARALTGCTVREGRFRFEKTRHDAESKTILGQSAEFDSISLADVLLEHPAAAKRLAWRLVQEFFGEGVVGDGPLNELAQQLQASNLNIGAAVETILHSELFFSDANIQTRICDPMSFLLAPLRAFEMSRRPPSTLLLASWLQRMGLDLFYPPNVGGWDGGRTWLNTRTVIARTNYASAAVHGELSHPTSPPDLKAVCSNHGSRSFAQFVGTLFGVDPQNTTASNEADVFVNLMSQPAAHLH
ncbi:MAG: DUF1800 domain-containing protein [Planctomycetaceae bacterium]|nr:DUF1800 domain-containing protein [Planctomycetaceae bacterium]